MKVVNKRYYNGPGTYIGRGSVWGNDWSHLPKSKAIHGGLASVEDAVFHYTDWLVNGLDTQARDLAHALEDGTAAFEHAVLICYCVDENGNGNCHGKVLAAIATQMEQCNGQTQDVWDEWQAKLDAKRHLYTPRCEGCEHHAFEFPGAIEVPNDGTCSRCGGTGFFESFVHVYDGRCFRCDGSGIDPDYIKEGE